MLSNIPRKFTKIRIHTGNILNLNEVKRKAAGQNPTEELVESLRVALKEPGKTVEIDNVVEVFSKEGVYTGEGYESSELTTSVKVFASCPDQLVEAVEKLVPYLEVEKLDSLVVAGRDVAALWPTLESLAQEGKLSRVGMSDIDTIQFIDLFHRAKVKPSIVQINLASCCVVPPQLQEFTRQHDIQLLTHNDPQELLPVDSVSELIPGGRVCWTARFQAQVKCRGVLATKGYLVAIDLASDPS